MEDILMSVTESQGIWTVLFVFLLLYTIKKNDKLDERQNEREQKYQMLLSELTEKFSLLTSVDKQLSEIYGLLRDTDKKR